MRASPPHFLLFSRADVNESSQGRWHFLLEAVDGATVIEASDEESGLRRERLELLAVVRGLEALGQPSRVTLITPSQRISRGFRNGLDEWRGNRWRWERDGRWIPIKNRDLWQRVDRALQFHRVECRRWRFETSPSEVELPRSRSASSARRWSEEAFWNWPEWRERIGAATRPLLNWPSQIGHWGAAS